MPDDLRWLEGAERDLGWRDRVHRTGRPTDLQEVVEAYFMHRHTEDQAYAFEEHYFVCPHCASIFQKIGVCVEAVRAARKARFGRAWLN